jgi:hypothetical protein
MAWGRKKQGWLMEIFHSDRIKRREIAALILCLLVGFALRFYSFDRKSLWLDEVHTFNDSRDGLKGQIEFYKQNPTYLHPPLFFVLTHQFYPFSRPEKDLRVIPLVFGTLSILMIYFLARSFSHQIALPCAVSLAFMTYHINFSQDGRSYSLVMFLGMAGLYFFIRHLRTLKKKYLLPVALFFSALFYTSYSSIPFIALSQILWFYRPGDEDQRPGPSCFLILNGLILLFCLPWVLFLASNYTGQPVIKPLVAADPGSFWMILYGVVHDWMPHAPLMIISVILLILFPFISKNKKNAVVLLLVFIIPIGGLYFYCKLLDVNHFVNSRYFISFLPLFLITLYLSLHAVEARFEKLKRLMRPGVLFVVLFIASNLVILPLYYRSEKQDFRGLAAYLKGSLREGDKIFVDNIVFIPGILHYMGAHPAGRHHTVSGWKYSQKQTEYRKSFVYGDKIFTIYYANACCTQYVADGNRLWIVATKWTAKNLKNGSPSVLKGYFDGSFLNYNRFPTDASMYLFLWDPKSPGEKGIDLPVE